jgi:hypothetical protein
MKRISPQPDAFRYTYTAFLAALRSITQIMQKEFSGTDGFSVWYETKQKEMGNSSALKYLHRQRSLTYHERPALIYPIGVTRQVTQNNQISYMLSGTGDTLQRNQAFFQSLPQYASVVEVRYYFSDFTESDKDVITICQEAVWEIEKIVVECESEFHPPASESQ